MKNILKMGTIGTLLLATAFGAMGTAAAAEQAKEVPPGVHSGVMNPGNGAYMRLLAKIYIPESAEEWKKAVEERKQAENDMTEATQARTKFKDELSRNYKPETAPKAPDVEYKENSATGKKQLFIDGKPADRYSNGRPIVDGKIVEGIAVAIEGMDGIIDKRPEQSEESKRAEAYAKAVEAGDTEAIRGLLPKLLDDYRKQTTAIKEEAARMKAEDAKIKAGL
ncbi:hypothetical protein [Paenibacillus oleatilyticus]|uniref:hypothetical protein n=1 Tax=Paenibacillus oleatilyticus TaxID=2594886 RepID=UPI001C1F5C2D|nr:hypothetical protein [Paenibacillus oleatilyticus]MBU7320849.1 hypothetical protein [Paenibacillus oleatilyticus]